MTIEEKKLHDQEICDTYLLRDEDITESEYAMLSIQDMCVLLQKASWMLSTGNEVDSLDKMEVLKERLPKMYSQLVGKIKTAPVLYSVIDKATGYAFITEINNSIWIYSKKEYAVECVEHYKEEKRNFMVVELSADNVANFLGRAFYTNGAGGVFVDNGQVGQFVAASDLIVKPTWEGVAKENIPVTNSDFMLAHLKMTQETGWKVEYESRPNVLAKLEIELVRALKKARFLVPNKSEKGEEGANKPDNHIPVLTNEEGITALPVFSDWDQFKMMYPQEGYHAWALDFDALCKVLVDENGYDNIIINVKTLPLSINKSVLERINVVAQNIEE